MGKLLAVAVLLLVVVLVLGLEFAPQEKGVCDMPIQFDYQEIQSINFGDDDDLTDIEHKLMSYWVYIDSWEDSSEPFTILMKGFEFDTYGWINYIGSSSHRPLFWQNWTTGAGVYGSNPDTLSLNTLYNIIIEYDGSSAANDAVIYINGASVTVNELVTPSGTIRSDAGEDLHLGVSASLTGYSSPSGWVGDVRLYDVGSHSVAEIAALVSDIYNGKGLDNNNTGLVFQCAALGAAGLQVFDGTTLDASNTIIDNAGLRAGVPIGNPLGAAETELSFP